MRRWPPPDPVRGGRGRVWRRAGTGVRVGAHLPPLPRDQITDGVRLVAEPGDSVAELQKRDYKSRRAWSLCRLINFSAGLTD